MFTMLPGADFLFEDKSLTRPPAFSPRGSDGARTPVLSHLVWYTSICLISSVHLSGMSGLNPAMRILSQSSQVDFKGFTGSAEHINSAKMFSGFQFSVIWLSQSCSNRHARCSSAGECHLGYGDEVTCVTLFPSQLVPWRRRAGVREQNDACSLAAITSSWTVRHYKAVRMTSEPYADNVPLSFVSLHYGPFVSQLPFSGLLNLSLHAWFTCLLSTSASFHSFNVWPPSPPPQLPRLSKSFYESLWGCKRIWFCLSSLDTSLVSAEPPSTSQYQLCLGISHSVD